MKDILPEFPRVTLTGSIESIDRRLQAQSNKLKAFRYDGPVGRFADKAESWSIEKFTVPKQSLLALRYLRDGGRGMAPGDYHRLVREEPTNDKKLAVPERTIVMSDTDAEMIDFLEIMRDVEGTVLVGGLGMGLAVKALLMSQRVKHVTVVERSPSLIKFLYDRYKCPRLNIAVGDIFKWPLPTSRDKFDYAWFDIWDTISDENLPDFDLLRERYQPVVRKGRKRIKFWAEYECRQMAMNVDPRHWY